VKALSLFTAGILCCAALLCLTPLSASGEELKIAQVNLSAVLQQSTRIKTAMAELQRMQEEATPKIDALEKDLQTIEDQIKKGGESLSGEDRKKLESSRKEKGMELQNEQQSARVKIAFKQKNFQNIAKKELDQILEKVAKEMKLNVVLRADALAYSAGVTDISERVIKEFDALPAMDKEPEAPQPQPQQPQPKSK
jgi:outer membrane protein